MRARRIPALDGLRGIAALAVVLHHTLIASIPALAAAYGTGRVHLNTIEWALVRTPLHILWAGPEFVIVFFVLSGFVLTLPALNGLKLAAYYPSRLLRLYLPVFGALVLAAFWRTVVAHHTVAGASVWLNWHMAAGTLAETVRIATLMLNVGSPRSGLTVLWSLHWEVLFSLALPLVVLLVRRVPATPLIALCLALSVSARLQFVTPFLIGAALATQRDQLERLPRTAFTAVTLSATVVLGLTANWWLGNSTVGTHLATAAITAGATAAIVLALVHRRPFETRSAQWAGTRSYSIYLVHEPIIVCAALLLHSWPLVLVAGVIVALGTSELFYRAIEHPAHLAARQAKKLGTAVGGGVRVVRGADPATIVREPVAVVVRDDELPVMGVPR